MSDGPRRIHGLLCDCDMCKADPTVGQLVEDFGWSSEDVFVAIEKAAAALARVAMPGGQEGTSG